MIKTSVRNAAPFAAIYFASFLFALHFTLPLYVSSSFLSQFVGENAVGFIYTASAIIILLTLPKFPKILSIFGNYKTAISILAAGSVALFALAFSTSIWFIIPLFITIEVLIAFGLFNLDVFLEAFSEDKKTGTIRGFMLTAINTGVLMGPIMAGILVGDGEFSKAYVGAAIILIPTIFIVSRYLKDFKDPAYRAVTFWKTLQAVIVAKHPYDEIRHVVISDFLLRFFFAWMIIYMPIYLNKYMGFNWSEVGFIIALALLPFVLFELPVGKIVDKIFHEKYAMCLGFFIAALFTMSLFFIESKSLVLWTVMLFGTRLGASIIEIASESHFFKQIDKADTNILSVFRNTQPLAFIAGPIIASVILAVLSMQYLFVALAILLILGMVNSSLIPIREKTQKV